MTNPYELKTLPHVAMAGPVEFSMIVHITTLEGKSGRFTMHLEPGIIPAPAHVKNILANCLKDETGNIPIGTRLMTKPEFIAHVTKRETGAAIVMEGPQVFEPPEDAIDKGMLVDAIIGKGIRNDNPEYSEAGERWVKDGFARKEWDRIGHGENWAAYRWNREKLDLLDETTLLKIYRFG